MMQVPLVSRWMRRKKRGEDGGRAREVEAVDRGHGCERSVCVLLAEKTELLVLATRSSVL